MNFAHNRRGLQIIETDHSCKKEEKIGALMKFLQQMANCPWILWWEKRKKNLQRIFYMSISHELHLLQRLKESYLRDSKLNYLTENDRKELEKEIFPSQVKTTIHSLSIGKSLGPDGCPTEF